MKTQLLAALTLALPMLIHAQPATESQIVRRDSKGIIRSIEFSEKDAASSLSDQAFMKQYLLVTPDDAFVKTRDKQRRADHVNDHFDQYYKGIKVDGGGYNFHYKDGKMYYAHGHFVKLTNLDVTPAITPQTARDAWATYKKIPLATIADFTAELIVKEIAPLDSAANLVYKIYLRSGHPANDEIGYVLAKTGRVVLTEPILTHASPVMNPVTLSPSSRPGKQTIFKGRLLTPATGTFATRYNGTRTGSTDDNSGSFRLLDETRGAIIHTWNLQGSTDFTTRAELTDNDNNWTTAEHSANTNDMALDVHWALQQIYDRLNNAHGINSFDDPVTGAGFPIQAHIRYGTATNDRDNAFWDGLNNILYFGSGDVTFRPVAALDAVAHEFGHGITDFQIGWANGGVQGSFNEGMSDIWGAIMEHRITGGNVWQIGEQLTLNNTCLRDLQNTNSANVLRPMADTFGSTQYNTSTGNPNADIYVRSGVLSHWAYLLANGGFGINGVGNGYSVNGIGMDQLENLIVHAVFNNFLDNTTSYDDVRNGMINAATALYGACSAQVIATRNAWYAVGVGQAAGSPFGKYTYGPNTFAFEQSTGISVSNTSNYITITLADYGPSATYSWAVTYQTGSSTHNFSGRTATLYLSGGASKNISCTLTNDCGTYTVSFACYNYSYYRYMVSPNPARDQLSIDFENDSEKNAFPEQFDLIEESVYGSGKPVRSLDTRLESVQQVLTTTKRLTMDVKDLPRGRYILRVTKEKEEKDKQISTLRIILE